MISDKDNHVRPRSAYSRHSHGNLLLLSTVIIICLANGGCLSGVDAIHCYQCNSYEQKDCLDLRDVKLMSSNNGTNTTQAANLGSQKYLKECVPGVGMRLQLAEVEPFCRKTVFTVDSSQEYRVIRGCGWLRESNPAMHNSCYNADSEGYSQVICTCNENNCNKAVAHLGLTAIPWWSTVLTIILLVLRMRA